MKNLDPKVVLLFSLKNFLSTFYILPFWFFGVYIFGSIWADDGTLPKEWILLILNVAGCLFSAFLLIGCYYWALFTVTNFLYELQNDGLHIQSGTILRKHLLIPYNRIASVDILINPFVVRFLGLYSLQISTRQVSNTEGILQKEKRTLIIGITEDTAKSLRTELLNYSHIQLVNKYKNFNSYK